ncbi:glutaminase [Labedella gwakjiensis]|uniref:Glutaminase n=3 Tax=Actinomycetes TaxID=1760 RepID=A0ABY0C5E6_9MICO|nr:glutaminase [Labedella gwakjiensis]
MMDIDVEGVEQRVFTGVLPAWDRVEEAVQDAHRRESSATGGTVADYIPALAEADPGLFGVCVVETDGQVHAAGDVEAEFSIQSVSKVLTYALASDAVGHDVIAERIGVNSTGQSFDSVMAIELNGGHTMNPMVNAGAIATTALLPGGNADERWEILHDALSRFAGRRLELDEDVYRSETEHNQRNMAIARLLESYGRLDVDPLEIVDVYTKQCSLRVTARDLAVMGATLADGGVNPVTDQHVVSPEACTATLAVMATSGLYERSGEWLFEIGIPGKSGVSGGILAVVPGKAGIGVYSPPLDDAGNSVRGQRALAYLSRVLGLNLFASAPRAGGGSREGDPDAAVDSRTTND